MEEKTIKTEEQVRFIAKCYRKGNPGVPFIDAEEKVKYEIFEDFYHMLVIPAVDEEICKIWGKEEEDPRYLEEGYADFVYSEFKDLVDKKWIELMSTYMSDLWDRLERYEDMEYQRWTEALVDSDISQDDYLPDSNQEDYLPF